MDCVQGVKPIELPVRFTPFLYFVFDPMIPAGFFVYL